MTTEPAVITARLLRALLALPLVFVLSSCGMLLPEAVVKRPPLKAGTPRSDIIDELGPPRKSVAYAPPRVASTLPIAPKAQRGSKVGRYDEYRVSGLVQLPNDTYRSEFNVYPAFVILTLGVVDVVATPIIAGDLTKRSMQRYDLRLWYDSSQRLLTHERH